MRYLDKAFLYVASVVASGALLVVLSQSAVSWTLFPQMLSFIGLIAVASYLIIRDPSGGVISSTATLFYVVLYLFDPLTSFMIVAVGYAIGNTLPRNWVTWRTGFNGAQMGLSVFLGSLSYRLLGGDPLDTLTTKQLIPAFAGPIAHQIANNFFIAALISLERRVRFLKTWMNFVRELVWSNLLSVPTAVLTAILYSQVHHAFVLLLLILLPFQSWVLRLYLSKRRTYARVIEHLVRAGELSLPRTRGHARRVASIAVAVSRELGLTDREVEAIEYAALLHDIGLIGINDVAGLQQSPEDIAKLREMHTRVGAEIASELGRADIVEMVLNHHTPFTQDPPQVLPGTRPSKGARIIAVAEDVDSRIHGLLPYAEVSGIESVLHSIREARGSLFEPQVVDAFEAVVRKRRIELSSGLIPAASGC